MPIRSRGLGRRGTPRPRHGRQPLVGVFTGPSASGAEVATGVFGADMQVSLVNDGPVTVLLEL